MGEEKRNLNISGSGSYPGGTFDSVRISGSGKITGDIECDKFSVSGAGKITGNIKCNQCSASGSSKIEGSVVANSISISGSGTMLGNVEAMRMTVSGYCKIGGDVSGGSVAISGSGKVMGDIKCEKVTISGAITTEKNIEAEEVNIRGCIKNRGFINAEKIRIDTKGTGYNLTEFNEIGATTVYINNDEGIATGLFNRLMELFITTHKVKGKLIEGDTVWIEHTKVNIIRGNNVKIGPYCEVEEIEYKESIEIDETAVVKASRQI